MMLIIALLLALLQMIIGVGVLSLMRIQLKSILFYPLAILLGIAVFSLVAFALQLLYVPITTLTVFGSLLITAIVLNLRFLRNRKQVHALIEPTRFKIEIYELPFLLLIVFIVFLSVWRCYYLPPAPFDAISGGELIAEYTIREKTMINSAFAVEPNGNTLKPAFLTSLQVLYKMAGFPFGQVWLSNVFISFIIILHHLLSKNVHRLIAWFLLLMFIAIPEMFGYTYMILYDYSNAVFFCLSIYFLIVFFKNQRQNFFWLSSLLMAIATYTRPEMPVLILMLLPMIFYNQPKEKTGFWKSIRTCVAFGLPSLIVYLLSVTIYITFYLPQEYSVAEQVNPNAWNISAAFKSIGRANTVLIFSKKGMEYYSYFIYIFIALFIAELIFKRRFNREARNYLYAIAVVYLAYPLLNHLLPGLTIENSVKRGYFKMFPLMVLYMSNNELLKLLSEKIIKWEFKAKQPGFT
jgi:hypothetical protein